MQFLQVNLDSLHKSLVDSELGFKECASMTKNDLWKQKFECFATKREQMMRDLELYGGASKSSSGTMKGGLSRAWNDIKASVSGGSQNIVDSISKEELGLKKAYEDALKSHGIASSLNGLLMDHIRKLDSDMSELHTLFGTESKILSPENQEKTSFQRKQSIGDKIKSTFGIVNTEQQHEKVVQKHLR
jgi:uncharacterized protein (TIGR02284 family)